ncbi:unnamed protein product, partial [Vitrella brassicaformis CCMP3155]
LPIDEAVCSARPISRAHGSQLVNEAFVQRRIAKHLSRHSLTGLIDVHRTAADTASATAPTPAPPTTSSSSSDAPAAAAAGGGGPHVSHFCYLCQCCYALEHGGAVWCEQWPDFIRLADIYKLTPSTGLPLIMSPQWMAAHLPIKADFHTMPLALRQYSTFGHLLNYQGTSLALTKVDEADDSDGEDGDEAKKGDGEWDGQGEGEGDGGVTRQRYTIGSGQRGWRLETVPLSALPPRHPYRRTYDSHNPPIRYLARYRHGSLFPSFTAFIRRMVLFEWFGQEGVDEKEVLDAPVGGGDGRYQRLLTEPIEGHTTIDLIYEGQGDGRERLIVLKGMKEVETMAAYLYLYSGRVNLFTTEASFELHTRLFDRFPIAMSLTRCLLTKHGLAHIIPQ